MQLPQIKSKSMNRKSLKPICFYIIAIMALSFFSGCANVPKAISADLNETFAIGVGQSARINGEDMAITFDEVIGDSRCPSNVVCVWAGVASVSVTITKEDESYSMALNQPGLSGNGTASFLDYTLAFNLDPYPIAGKEVSSGDYLLTLTISK